MGFLGSVKGQLLPNQDREIHPKFRHKAQVFLQLWTVIEEFLLPPWELERERTYNVREHL